MTMPQIKTTGIIRTALKFIGKVWLAIYAIILLLVGFRLMKWLQPQVGWIIGGVVCVIFLMTPPIAMALWSDECKRHERERIQKENPDIKI